MKRSHGWVFLCSILIVLTVWNYILTLLGRLATRFWNVVVGICASSTTRALLRSGAGVRSAFQWSLSVPKPLARSWANIVGIYFERSQSTNNKVAAIACLCQNWKLGEYHINTMIFYHILHIFAIFCNSWCSGDSVCCWGEEWSTHHWWVVWIQ